MSRQEKRSRVRMLPPIIQLQQKDALTGSYPTTSRFSGDGRSGTYDISFDDTKTVIYTSSSLYSPAVGFGTNSVWMALSTSNDLTRSIVTTGSIRSQIIEDLPFFHFSPGQNLTPFRDNKQPAADGKSTNDIFFTTGSADLTVGGGFSSPLWSKNKIEIDISVPVACGSTLFISGHDYGTTFPVAGNRGVNQEMLYYNFALKKWEGIGQGLSYASYHNGISGDGTAAVGGVLFEEYSTIGFSPSIINLWFNDTAPSLATQAAYMNQVSGVFELQAAAGQPINNFGFPYHPKFHGTGSQTCDMSQYISAPFLVEKIVVELSAAYNITTDVYNTGSYWGGANVAPFYTNISEITGTTVPAAINNFFILNQRRSNRFEHKEIIVGYSEIEYGNDALIMTSSVPRAIQLSKSGVNTYVDTVRDIITWGGVSSFANNMPTSATRSGTPSYASAPVTTLTLNPKALMTRDCVFTSSTNATGNLSPLSWSGKVYMELPTKSPNKIDPNPLTTTGIAVLSVEAGSAPFSTENIAIHVLKYTAGGRDGLGIKVPNGRNFLTTVGSIQEQASFQGNFGVGISKTWSLLSESDFYRYNPYVLLPTDQLIFGWQQPIISSIRSDARAGATGNFKNCNTGSFSSISFLPGDAKITLYGSYVRDGKESNDSLNQLLSSPSIHEVIE